MNSEFWEIQMMDTHYGWLGCAAEVSARFNYFEGTTV